MTKSVLHLKMFNRLFLQVAVSWDICKALLQWWLELLKITLWGISGRSRGVKKSILEASGGAPEEAKRFQKSLRDGKRCPRASKKDLGAILGPKTAKQRRSDLPIWEAWGGLWGGFGASWWRFFERSCCASLFYRFLSILGQFRDCFWYQFGSKKEKELMQKPFQKQAKSKKASL